MNLNANTRRRTGSALVFLLSVFIGNNAHAATISAPSDFIITQGQTGAVPISVTDAGSGIVGADVTLQFDSSVIEVFGSGSSAIQQSGFATDGWIMEQNVVSVSGTTKELRISAASSGSALPAAGTSTLFPVTFQAVPAAGPASSPLLLSLADLNKSAVSVTSGSVKLVGDSGAMTLSPDPVKPSRDVTVTLADADLNTDPASAKSVSVTINSETGGGATQESQSVSLTQTGVNTGTFTATITTVFGVSATAGGAFEVEPGDDIMGAYTDAFDAAGDAGTSVTDSIDVVAGVDGTASTSPAQVNGGDLVTVTVVDPDEASAGTRIIGAPFTISSTLENTPEQGRGKNRRSEMAFVLPTLYQIALHGRWEASGDRNADLLRSETADSVDVGAYIESREDIEIKWLMSGAYPEHMGLEVGEGSATKAYVTAQSFGVDSLGAPQSARL